MQHHAWDPLDKDTEIASREDYGFTLLQEGHPTGEKQRC